MTPAPAGEVEHRIADRRMQRLIQKWLKAGVSEDGQWSRTTVGTPQGAVISPLLANIYLHWFDKVFHGSNGPARWAGAKLVRYADDCAPG